MRRDALLEYLHSGTVRLEPVYGPESGSAVQRLTELTEEFAGTFDCDGASETRLFSTPGRAELGGSHIDHQLGHGLAASVNLDTIACVTPNDSRIIRIKSRNHRMAVVELDDLSCRPGETGSSMALVRGIAAFFSRVAGSLHGLDVYTTTTVLRGSGLSSSAAFEVLTANIFNHFFCNGELPPVQVAQAAHYAENVYFQKPSGVLDQLACATGGVIGVDFAPMAQGQMPDVQRLSLDFSAMGHALCIIDTRASHAALVEDFAAIPREMQAAAQCFGREVLRYVPYEEFFRELPRVRAACGDRAALRAYHYFQEDMRVRRQTEALRQNNFSAFLQCVRESGRSSFMYLQNATNYQESRVQPLGVLQAAAEALLDGTGAVRVHGGGFAGTMMVFVPLEKLDRFVQGMEAVSGPGTCHILHFRSAGSTLLLA
ncbi:MAG: galactokinase [Oscillospiraceae bacterium]|nr:galactokinase [Oscillospiraceae bacterium]